MAGGCYVGVMLSSCWTWRWLKFHINYRHNNAAERVRVSLRAPVMYSVYLFFCWQFVQVCKYYCHQLGSSFYMLLHTHTHTHCCSSVIKLFDFWPVFLLFVQRGKEWTLLKIERKIFCVTIIIINGVDIQHHHYLFFVHHKIYWRSNFRTHTTPLHTSVSLQMENSSSK